MSHAPEVAIDPRSLHADPYPTLQRLRAETPIAFVPALRSTVLTRRDDIAEALKRTDVFSSSQPGQLMETLMGTNMMRKDGDAHAVERRTIASSVSPKAAKEHWRAEFAAHAERLLAGFNPDRPIDLFSEFSAPFAAECLKTVTGLVNMRWQDMDAWSQAMMDGIVNHADKAEVTAGCQAATAGIDASIDARVPALQARPDASLLATMLAAGMPMEQIRANIKLAISGGQNEPRDALAGTVWALLTHPDQLAALQGGTVPWLQAYHEYLRWLSPIGAIPRRVAQGAHIGDVEFEPNDRVLLFLSSANRDEGHYQEPDRFDITRDTGKQLAFGAGPHFCAGAWVSRTMVADVALPMLFARLTKLRLLDKPPVRFVGWTFRGPLNLPVVWKRP